MATPQTQRTVADVLQDIVANIQQIIRDEFRLAKVELKEKGARASRPAGMLATGAALGFYALGFVLVAAMFALSIVMPHWLAALLIALFLGIAAVTLVSASIGDLKQIDPVPEKTVQTVKENVQWVKEQTK